MPGKYLPPLIAQPGQFSNMGDQNYIPPFIPFVPTNSGTTPALVCPVDGVNPVILYPSPGGITWQCSQYPDHFDTSIVIGGGTPSGAVFAAMFPAALYGTLANAPQAQPLAAGYVVAPTIPIGAQPTVPPPPVQLPIGQVIYSPVGKDPVNFVKPTPAPVINQQSSAEQLLQQSTKMSYLTMLTRILKVANTANTIVILDQQAKQMRLEQEKSARQDDRDILIIGQSVPRLFNVSSLGQPTTNPPVQKIGGNVAFGSSAAAQAMQGAIYGMDGIGGYMFGGTCFRTLKPQQINPSGPQYVFITTWAGVDWFAAPDDPLNLAAGWVVATIQDAAGKGHPDNVSGNRRRNDFISSAGSADGWFVTQDQVAIALTFPPDGPPKPSDGPPRGTSQFTPINDPVTINYQFFQRVFGTQTNMLGQGISPFAPTRYDVWTSRTRNNTTAYSPPELQRALTSTEVSLLDGYSTAPLFRGKPRSTVGRVQINYSRGKRGHATVISNIGVADGHYDVDSFNGILSQVSVLPRSNSKGTFDVPFGGLHFAATYAPAVGTSDVGIRQIHWYQVVGSNRIDRILDGAPLANPGKTSTGFQIWPDPGPDKFGFWWHMDTTTIRFTIGSKSIIEPSLSPFYDDGGAAIFGWFLDTPISTLPITPVYWAFAVCLGWPIDDASNPIDYRFQSPNSTIAIGLSTKGLQYAYQAVPSANPGYRSSSGTLWGSLTSEFSNGISTLEVPGIPFWQD